MIGRILTPSFSLRQGAAVTVKSSLRIYVKLSLSPPPPPSPAPAGLSGFDRRTGGFGGPTLYSIPTSTPSSKRSTGNRVWPWGHVWCWRPRCSRGRGWCKWSPHLHQQQQQQCKHHDFISLCFFIYIYIYLIPCRGGRTDSNMNSLYSKNWYWYQID